MSRSSISVYTGLLYSLSAVDGKGRPIITAALLQAPSEANFSVGSFPARALPLRWCVMLQREGLAIWKVIVKLIFKDILNFSSVIQLMDANLILGDTKIGETEIDTSSMEIGQVLRKTITFQPHQVCWRAARYPEGGWCLTHSIYLYKSRVTFLHLD